MAMQFHVFAFRACLLAFALLSGCSVLPSNKIEPAVASADMSSESKPPEKSALPPQVSEKSIPVSTTKRRGLPASTGEKNYATVRVYFGTDRKPTANPEPAKVFSAESANAITYGSTDVSIPRDHRMGELESPSIWRLEFQPNPEKHVVLLAVAQKDKESFFSDVVKRARASARPSAFVFIHGYNVSFADAARRTAQMTYDLGFEGAPLFYSWPSKASLTGYWDDEQAVLRSEPIIKAFLADIANRLDREDIYVIAHSMGNRPTSLALASLLTERPELRARFKEIMLVAPDIDANVFKTEIAPKLVSPGQRITLYVSSNDLALKASRLVHGGQRLGDSNPTITVIPGIESIDASEVETDFLGHSYFADPRSVLSDLFEVFRGKDSADLRSHLTRIRDVVGDFFRFRKPEIAASKL